MPDDSEHLLIRGDARRIPLVDGCVQCVVTSPPYFNLRDYSTASWVGGDPACEHAVIKGPVTEKYKVCRCLARQIDPQIGLEPTPGEFVAALVGVFREVWRVLRDDGVVWLNLGDSYANDTKWGGTGGNSSSKNYTSGLGGCVEQKARRSTGLKPKDRMGIPHRVVFALQEDGWYWRDEIVWHKRNPMPESVTDRTTKAHEMVFLLTKRERYFYDADAISEPATYAGCDRGGSTNRYEQNAAGMDSRQYDTRNKRSVWTINPAVYKDAHFATMPPELAETCIKAGSKPGDLILDQFNGAGTTGLSARRLGRRYVGLDLSRDYLAMSERRIADGLHPVSKLDPRPVSHAAGQMSFFGPEPSANPA